MLVQKGLRVVGATVANTYGMSVENIVKFVTGRKRGRRKSCAMLVLTFLLYGGLNQITWRCLFCLVDVSMWFSYLVYIYMCVCVCMMYIYVCVYIYVYVYIYIYIYIFIFITWEAPRASKMEQYCPLGIARFVPAITFRRSPSRCTKVFFRKIFSVTMKRFSVIFLSEWN